ncbi:MAG: rhomboid family intramembrane serine protease [Minicystis sp.]
MIPVRDLLPTRRAPLVTYALITLNVLVFLGERLVIGAGLTPARLLAAWGLVPAAVIRAPLENGVTVVTSMFMHDPAGYLHLGGNMLFLWIFGDNVEDALGRVRYLAFYLLSGLAAAAAQMLVDPSSHVPMVGASGAIAGVLAAYGSLYPRAPITVVNPILPLWFVFGIFIQLPAWVIILEFFAVNLWSGLGGLGLGAQGGVAFFAHLGGFVAGLFLVRVLVSDRPGRAYLPWDGWRAPPRRPLPPSRPHGYAPRRHGPWD